MQIVARLSCIFNLAIFCVLFCLWTTSSFSINFCEKNFFFISYLLYARSLLSLFSSENSPVLKLANNGPGSGMHCLRSALLFSLVFTLLHEEFTQSVCANYLLQCGLCFIFLYREIWVFLPTMSRCSWCSGGGFFSWPWLGWPSCCTAGSSAGTPISPSLLLSLLFPIFRFS